MVFCLPLKKKIVKKKSTLQNQAHNICVLTNWMCQNCSCCPCRRLLAPLSHCSIRSSSTEQLCSVTHGLLREGAAGCQTHLSLHWIPPGASHCLGIPQGPAPASRKHLAQGLRWNSDWLNLEPNEQLFLIFVSSSLCRAWPRASITACYSNPAQNAPLLISPCFLWFPMALLVPFPASTICLKWAVNLTHSARMGSLNTSAGALHQWWGVPQGRDCFVPPAARGKASVEEMEPPKLHFCAVPMSKICEQLPYCSH